MMQQLTFQCFPCNQQILVFSANLLACFPHWGQHDTLSQRESAHRAVHELAVAGARCHTSPLPILLSICPLDAFFLEYQEEHPKGSYLSRTYDGLAGQRCDSEYACVRLISRKATGV